MTQGEFTHILETFVRPKVAELTKNAAFATDKIAYIKQVWDELRDFLEQYNFDEQTFKDLNVRYRNQIENDIRKKYFC